MDVLQELFFLWGFFVTPLAVFALHSWGLEWKRKSKAFEAAFDVAETERKHLAEKVHQLEIQLMRMSSTVVKGSFAPDSIFSDSGSRGR